MAKNPAAYAAAVGAVLEKDLSTDAAFVDHLLANFGIASTNAVFADAKAALTGMVAGQGRVNAAVNAINFLADQKVGSAYAAIATAFQAKVNAAASFSTVNSKELDVSKLVAAVTGVDTDVVATDAAFAAGAASRNKEVTDLTVSVAALNTELTAVKAAAAAAATAAAAAATAAAAAATKAAADLAAANATIAVIDDTAFTSESAAAAAAKTAAEAAAATAAVKAAADLAAAQAEITALKNPAGGNFVLTAETDVVIGRGNGDVFTATSATLSTADVVIDAGTNDADVMNITLTDDIDLTDATIVGIETVNFNVDAFSTAAAATTLEVDLGGVSATNVAFDVVQSGSRVVAIDLDEVRSGTLTLSNELLTATVTGNNNADIVINANNAATATFSLTQDAAGGEAVDDLTVISTGAVTLTNVDADGVVTVRAARNITVTDADPATTLVATSTGGQIEVTSANGATSITLTAAEDADIAAATGATTLTISAVGTSAMTTLAADKQVSTITATAATTINASGNGGALEINAAGSTLLGSFNYSGTQDVEIQMSAVAIENNANLTSDKITATDTGTGVSRLTLNTTAGNVNATEASAIDVIELAVDNATKTLTVASGETVQISVSQGAGTTTIASTQATAALNSVNVIISDDSATHNNITLTADAFSHIKTVNVSLLDNLVTATSLTGATTTDFVFTGARTLTIAGNTTAGQLNASALTGVVTADLTGGAFVSTISTGSAADAITVTNARTSGNFTINTGAGNDIVNMIDAGAVIDGGAGDDTVRFAATADLTGQTLGLTAVEVLDIDGGTETTNTLTIDGSQLTGKSINVTSSAGGANDALTVTVNDSVTNLSGLVVDKAAVATTITANAYTAVVAATVTGTNDDDTITGNGGRSFTANGGAGDDTITGGAAADTLNGDAGADELNGAGGADVLNGGAGADVLNGDGGADVLTGGAGDDNFNYGTGESTAASMDSITDYQGAVASADNDTLTFAGTADGTGTGVVGVVANVAATDDVSAHTADAAGVLTANQIEIVINDGILTLAGEASYRASIDTLTEWINVALLAFENADFTAAGQGDTNVDVLAFVFGGDTYVVSALDIEGTNDTMAVSNIVKLVGITNMTDVATAAAATTILVA
ncbi:calcium-binding protein [Limnohabitans sp. Rim28]|uniref:beta strand repeat-containing protein n=1 Tax=Limnohabitans sp. Rim28 TaxID=1100720 RepID=UPI0010573B64|nr:calcium-binding protein [Limnohabitans sp. Rim28]